MVRVFSMIKKWVLFVTLYSTMLYAQNNQIQQCHQKYQSYIDQMNIIQTLNQDEQYSMMLSFFKSINQEYTIMIKQLHADLSIIKKHIRQCKKNKQEHDLVCKNLKLFANDIENFYKFLKKYRILYQAIYFEQQVKQRFHTFFQAVSNGSDIESLLVDFGIQESGRNGLKILLKLVVKDLSKIEYDERRLHADWIDAKLSNYVLKIELVRLRNAILFHPSYKKIKFVFASNYPR